MSFHYSINIAKAYTLSDWRGLPAHSFMARIALDDALSEYDAQVEMARLQDVYPWPQYHLTLSKVTTTTVSEGLTSSAPADFLQAHQWRYESVHTEKGGA